MKKIISCLMIMAMCLSYLPQASFAEAEVKETIKETFDSASALENFTNSGGGVIAEVVANPDTAVGGSVFKQYNSGIKASWIQSNTNIVPAGSTGIYEVGVDLYVPKAFNDNPANLLTMSINGSSGCRFRMMPDNSTVSTTDPKTQIPYDEWFRAVYEFNLDAGTYSAYLTKDGAVISQMVTNAKSGVSSTNGVSVQSVRIHLSASNLAIYMDNFSIGMPIEHKVPRMETFDSEEALENFEYAGGPTVDIVPNPDTTVGGNALRQYNLATGASWVRNKTVMVPPNPSGIYDIGVDMYIPKEFNADSANVITITQNSGLSFKLVPDSSSTDGIKNLPYDEWFRIVYEFDFNAGKYSAYLAKDGKEFTRIFNGNKIPDSVITNGLTQLRVHMSAERLPIYLDNFTVETVVEYDLLGCEAFDSDSALAGFDNAGNPTLSVVQNPDNAVGGSVLKHYNENTTGSWIRNKKIIVPPNYSGTCEVGVDLYLPEAFNASTTGRMDIMLNSGYRIDVTSENYSGSQVPGIEAKIPSNTWVRVVYELNFDRKLFNAYIMKDGKVYSTLKKNGALAANILETGITTMRVFLQCGTGENLAVYEDNFGIKNDSFGIYNFEDAMYDKTLETAGNADWSVVADPTEENRGKVLKYTHSGALKASWIKNITTLGGYKSGKWEVGADVYVPSDALADYDSYIRFTINDDDSHIFDLIPEHVKESTIDPYETQYVNKGLQRTADFIRDKWLRVRFVIDLDNNKYSTEILCDGKIITRQQKDISATSIKKTGIRKLRMYMYGTNQTVYVDNFGIAECNEETVPVPGVRFLRVDGLNMAGEELSIYGDFVDGASCADLTDIAWTKSTTQYGEYERIPEADNLVKYTPKDGGYYIQVSAKFGFKTLETIPVYVRPEGDKITLKPYLVHNNGKLNATVVYRNEGDAKEADILAAVYQGDTLVDVQKKELSIPSGNDIIAVNFDKELDMEGKTALCMILDSTQNMVPMCTSVGLSAGLPEVEISTAASGSTVSLDGELLADFVGNRTERFRASTQNDHWIGTKHDPTEMGFGYKDTKVAGFSCTDVSYEIYPGVFKIAFEGLKPVADTTQTVEFIGFWNEELNAFEYIRNASLTSKTDTWHKKSSWAWHNELEVFDFHLERMSIVDRYFNNNLNGDLYDYVIYSEGAPELRRIPKLPVPSFMIDGTYFVSFFLSPGGKYYMPDAKEGGWEATLLDASADTHINICWSWYDIHNTLRHMVPQKGSDEYFTASQSWLYTPTTAEYDKAVIDRGQDVDYKDVPNYQLPVFSENNTFDRQFGGTDWEWPWRISSYNCTMDSTVGHTDTSSVKISNSTKSTSSWYNDVGWTYPYSFLDANGKTYKVSGWIKTENVVGEAYIANKKNSDVVKSAGISGTNDWTYVEAEFVAGKYETGLDAFYLTLDGTGTVWFDDVKIEPVE